MYSTDVPVPALLIQKCPPAPGGRTAMPHAFTISGLTICGWKLALLATRIVWTNWLPGAEVVRTFPPPPKLAEASCGCEGGRSAVIVIAKLPLAISQAATMAAFFMSSFLEATLKKASIVASCGYAGDSSA